MVKKREKKPDLFQSLKRHFVMNAALLSAGVIFIAFSMIYLTIKNSFTSRRPVEVNLKFHGVEVIEHTTIGENIPENGTADEQMQNFFDEKIKADREKSLETLLLTLILTGFGIEVIVIVASLIAAENSIHPVKEAYEAQKTFVSNASHELKTPLAVIQANLEAADIEGNHWLDNAMQKVEEATELNNSLLTLARMDQLDQKPAKKSNVKLDKLVLKTADFYLPKMTEKGIDFNFKAEENLEPMQLAKADLAQLLNILLDNAVKYAEKSIKVKVFKNRIVVKNDGTTIEKDKLKHIFDRFYQTDKSKPGVGLGLSIAKSLANKNNWKLEAASDEKTTTFTLKLL